MKGECAPLVESMHKQRLALVIEVPGGYRATNMLLKSLKRSRRKGLKGK